MNFKKFGVSKNVMPSAVAETKELNGITIACDGNGTYTVSGTATAYAEISFIIPEFTIPISVGQGENGTLSFFNTLYNANNKIIIKFMNGDTLVDSWSLNAPNRTNTTYATLSGKLCNKIALTATTGMVCNGEFAIMFTNDGQLPAEFEPHMIWHDAPHYIHNTSTDTITTLPADIYANATTATVGMKGNTVQTGTPTPENPIMPEGTGDLEIVGAKAGQYKIPISSANTTTPVYLGEVQTERRIGKLVLTGGETWYVNVESGNQIYNLRLTVIPNQAAIMCNAFKPTTWGAIRTTDEAINVDWTFAQRTINIRYDAVNSETLQDSLDNFKTYLAQQYANGTPVTVWYVLASETTGIVNEPLMKIGSYADEVLGITIPTIAGANTLSVDTTLQPSEVTVNYKGWHPVSSAHERSGGAWT